MKIWYDVSGIYGWQGNFTGIQRVVYNLGKELHTHDTAAGFFVYRHGVFQAIDFAELEQQLNTRGTQADTSAVRQKRKVAKAQHAIMVGLKGAVRGTRYEASMRKVYNLLRSFYRTSRRLEATKGQVKDIFERDDIVVVVDGNWQFNGYAHELVNAKKRTACKIVHMVHDLVAVRVPALANPGADRIIGSYFKELLPFTDALITVSEATKRDVQWFADHFHVPHPKICVLTLGDNISPDKRTWRLNAAAAVTGPFILAVSTIEVRKNYTALYYAYKLAQQQGISLPHLVIVGRKGWMAEEVYALLTKDTDLTDAIRIMQDVSDEQLYWLYDHCLFTLFPSFYEGWGLPVSESLAHGKCCISSNTSSMPEVGGELALYVSPYNPAEMLASIQTLLDESFRHEREADIRARYQVHTWQQTFSDFMAIIQNDIRTLSQ